MIIIPSGDALKMSYLKIVCYVSLHLVIGNTISVSSFSNVSNPNL